MPEGTHRGELFPDLVLADLKGRPFKVSDLRGKIAVLHFWGTWCPSCVHELPQFVKLRAGKSTLLLALARLLRPERGSIAFEGAPLTAGDDLAYRRRIGLVLPAPLLLSASVFDNVAAGLRFRRVPAAETGSRVEHWLDRFSIAHLRDRPARQLSTGGAQRASLARALVLEPDLLLLDEPFASLDAATRTQLTDDFDRLRRGTATTCVLVTTGPTPAVTTLVKACSSVT